MKILETKYKGFSLDTSLISNNAVYHVASVKEIKFLGIKWERKHIIQTFYNDYNQASMFYSKLKR